jgi:hypothetical protein
MHFGNPFGRIWRNNDGVIVGHTKGLVECVLLGEATRDDTITAYRQWLLGQAHQGLDPLRRQWILDKIHTLVDKSLGCYCAPKTCHCDVLKELADAHAVAQ